MANKILDSIGKSIVSLGNKLTEKSVPTTQILPANQIQGVVDITNSSNIKIFGFSNHDHNLNTAEGISEALRDCPPISYILYKKALMFINGKLKVIDKRKNKEIEDYTKFKYNQLLATPNILQSDIQFRIQVLMTIQAFGYCPILRIRGPFNTITAMYILPPEFCEFKKSGKLMKQLNYSDLFDSIKFNGKVIPKEDVYVFTDITPYSSNELFPDSRLVAYSEVVNTISENYSARLALMKNRGSKGILSNETTDSAGFIPILPTEREQLQKDFQRYNFNGGDMDVIITNKSLRWQPMTLPMKDMMMLEQEEHDIMTLCDALALEHMLLSRGSDATYTNKPQAETFQYQSVTIPEALNYYQQLNDCLDAVKEGFEVQYDFSHVSALQTDAKLKSEAYKNTVASAVQLFTNNGCTFKAFLTMCEQPSDNAPELYFYQMPIEFQQSFKNQSSNNQNTNQNTN